MKPKDLQIDTLKSVGVTQIIPEQWEDFIWTDLSDGAPFSWGDNNHSLVDAHSFLEHLESIMEGYNDISGGKEHLPAVRDTLNYLQEKNIFVDLEQ